MDAVKVNQHLIGKSYKDIVDHLEIVEEQGDCCGYAGANVCTALPADLDTSTLVLKDCVQISYEEEYASARTVLNFIFSTPNGDEVVYGYELSAGSGSGWSYGAYVKLMLQGEVLAEESW